MICDSNFYGFKEILRHRQSKDGHQIVFATIGSSMLCVACLDKDNQIFGQKCFCLSYSPRLGKKVQLSALHYYNELKNALMKKTIESYR